MFLKESFGTSQMTCLLRMESSKVSVKETCLFHNRDGSFLGWGDVQRLGKKLIKLITNLHLIFLDSAKSTLSIQCTSI